MRAIPPDPLYRTAEDKELKHLAQEAGRDALKALRYARVSLVAAGLALVIEVVRWLG